MREKIIKDIYDKIREGFKTDFLPRNIFEQEFNTLAAEYKTKFLSALGIYEKLKQSPKEEDYSQVIALNEGNYVVDSFKDERPKSPMLKHGNLTYLLRNEGVLFDETPDTLKKRLKIYKEYDTEQFSRLKKEYKKLLSERNDKILIPFFDFFRKTGGKVFSLKDGQEQTPHSKLRNHVNESITKAVNVSNEEKSLFDGFDFYSHSPDCSLEYFKKAYERDYGKYMALLENADKSLMQYASGITALNDFCVNVGTRNFHKDRYKLINTFHILDEKLTIPPNTIVYSFENTQDCREIECDFVTIFILVPAKRLLIKISVSPTETLEYTPYLIFKQVQKVSIVRNSILEVHIHKHFDREVIVFDTVESAKNFQSKITQCMEGRRNYERENKYSR